MNLIAPRKENIAALRAELRAAGCRASVRRFKYSCRVVLADARDKDKARDAFVLSGVVASGGLSFASPDSRLGWNGSNEIFVYFTEAA